VSQLEGTENRITVARNRYIQVGTGLQRRHPQPFRIILTAMMFGYKEKPNFSVANEKEISTAPSRFQPDAGGPVEISRQQDLS